MKEECITPAVCFGEALEQSQEDNSNCLYLRYLCRIEVRKKGKTLLVGSRNDYFWNPPTLEVHLIREILDALQIELIARKDFVSSGRVTVKVTAPTELVQTESGFWSRWNIRVGEREYGFIKETGNFYDRDAEIIIDVPQK